MDLAAIALAAAVSTPAFATEYGRDDQDNSTASIDVTAKFIPSDGDEDIDIPAPGEDPDDENNSLVIPVNPDNPSEDEETNTDPSELKILYASSWRFGDVKKTDSSWNALAQPVRDADEIFGEVVPFVTTSDLRGPSEQSGWTLQVKQDAAFTDSFNHELRGATLTVSNLSYGNSSIAPSAVKGEIMLNDGLQPVANAPAEKGTGQWSLAFGQLDNTDNPDVNTTATGITLYIPSSTSKNTAKYSTTITWVLSADPSI